LDLLRRWPWWKTISQLMKLLPGAKGNVRSALLILPATSSNEEVKEGFQIDTKAPAERVLMETLRQTRRRPRTRLRDYVSRLAWERLGPPPFAGGAGGGVWGGGPLDVSAESAALATRSQIKRKMTREVVSSRTKVQTGEWEPH
ncbi:hypothetical protein CHARACLAT_016313, partial [Characodon lateralis]|nr:hypothetical protein [Characodon lateralis]